MKQLKVISAFYDLKEGVDRFPRDSFSASEERADELLRYRLVSSEADPDVNEAEPAPVTVQKKRTRKKKE